MNETVDVILATHKRPHTVEYSVRSVLEQTYPALQLHVVGDGCDDVTASRVRSFQDERLHFYRFPKASGFGYVHRNKILRETSGSYVAYATDDDLWFPDHLERALSRLRKKEELGMVAFRYCHVDFPDTLDLHFFALDWGLLGLGLFLRNWFMGAVTCVHERRVFGEVGYWDDTLPRFGDRDFYHRVRVSPIPCEYVDEVTVMRFFALHWDGKYEKVEGPPQQRYLARLRDPAWCRELRHQITVGRRSPSVFYRQSRDFTLFALHSGPRFLRFWAQKAMKYFAR